MRLHCKHNLKKKKPAGLTLPIRPAHPVQLCIESLGVFAVVIHKDSAYNAVYREQLFDKIAVGNLCIDLDNRFNPAL